MGKHRPPQGENSFQRAKLCATFRPAFPPFCLKGGREGVFSDFFASNIYLLWRHFCVRIASVFIFIPLQNASTPPPFCGGYASLRDICIPLRENKIVFSSTGVKNSRAEKTCARGCFPQKFPEFWPVFRRPAIPFNKKSPHPCHVAKT